jgi:hypothetical protein
MLPEAHSHQFKEMLHITKLLPAGKIAKLKYYMMYHKADQQKTCHQDELELDEVFSSSLCVLDWWF